MTKFANKDIMLTNMIISSDDRYYLDTFSIRSDVLIGCIALLFACCALLLSPQTANAQTVTAQSRKDSVQITADPRFPKPGKQINLSVSSLLVSLEGATIKWVVNGKIIDQGAGVTKTQFIVPEDSRKINVKVRIKPAGKQVITKQTTVRVSTVDIVWEANTFTPPFYEGKAVYTGAGKIKAVALPFIYKQSGEQYRKKNLIYEWKYNGLVHGSDSGLGKNTFNVDVNRANNAISVTVKNRSGQTVGQENIEISTQQPRLNFYQKTPATGVQLSNQLNKRINNVDKKGSLIAYPFFFPGQSAQGGNIQYQWYVNNERVEKLKQKNVIPLSGIQKNGEVNVSTEVESTKFIFPSLQNDITLSFE